MCTQVFFFYNLHSKTFPKAFIYYYNQKHNTVFDGPHVEISLQLWNQWSCKTIISTCSHYLSTNNRLIPLCCWNQEFNTYRSFVENLELNWAWNCSQDICKLSCSWPMTTWPRDTKTDPVFQLISCSSDSGLLCARWPRDQVLAITISSR